MTFDEALKLPANAPVQCADGAFGILIRWYQDSVSVGVQVYGEPVIREIPTAQLVDVGNGALSEQKS